MSFACPIYMPGGTFFFTVRLQDPSSDLLIRHIDLLRLSVRLCQQQHPFTIQDAVILPDRMHMIWALPPGDTDYAARWRTIKTTFARHLPSGLTGKSKSGGMGLWQRRYWEHPIQNAQDLAECTTLIAEAPVLAGLVGQPAEWPYSTSARTARATSRTQARRQNH